MALGSADSRVQDPRLLEIRYLSDLNRQRWTPWSPGTAAAYGIEPDIFHAMVLQLLHDECVQGDHKPPNVHTVLTAPPPPRSELWWSLRGTILAVMGQQSCMLGITHAGRLRLSRLQEEMDRSRIRDPFGILIDRRHFETDMRVRIWTLGVSQPLSLVAADLDNFGVINKEQSYSKGDEILRRYLSIVRDLAPSAGGEGYRMGGDETVSIHPGLSADGAREYGEQLRLAAEREFAGMKAGDTLAPTVSVGVLTYTTRPPTSPEDAWAAVTERVNAAKKAGRNRVVSGVL